MRKVIGLNVFVFSALPSGFLPCSVHALGLHTKRGRSQGSPETGPPPPPAAPQQEDAFQAVNPQHESVTDSEVLSADGSAPLVPDQLVKRAVDMAYEHLSQAMGGGILDPKHPLASGAFRPRESVAPRTIESNVTNSTNSTTPSGESPVGEPLPGPRLGPPRVPQCPSAPHNLTKADVQMAMLPFKPMGHTGKPVKVKDGGVAWKLDDGGWAFQYPDMAARMGADGETRIAWPDRAYAVQMNDDGISYHAGDTVIHRDVSGDLVFHQPTGTIHQRGDTIVYHYCHPNVIIYHTPAGIVYYDDEGMTYHGKEGVVHYGRDGELVYQGADGITKRSPNGDVTHWTESGAIYRHADGTLSYTAVGESESRPLDPAILLGPDPFPGPPLSEHKLLEMAIAEGATPTDETGHPVDVRVEEKEAWAVADSNQAPSKSAEGAPEDAIEGSHERGTDASHEGKERKNVLGFGTSEEGYVSDAQGVAGNEEEPSSQDGGQDMDAGEASPASESSPGGSSPTNAGDQSQVSGPDAAASSQVGEHESNAGVATLASGDVAEGASDTDGGDSLQVSDHAEEESNASVAPSAPHDTIASSTIDKDDFSRVSHQGSETEGTSVTPSSQVSDEENDSSSEDGDEKTNVDGPSPGRATPESDPSGGADQGLASVGPRLALRGR